MANAKREDPTLEGKIPGDEREYTNHLLLEDIVDESGFSSTEETCDYRDRSLILIMNTRRRAVALAFTSKYLVVVLLIL